MTAIGKHHAQAAMDAMDAADHKKACHHLGHALRSMQAARGNTKAPPEVASVNPLRATGGTPAIASSEPKGSGTLRSRLSRFTNG